MSKPVFSIIASLTLAIAFGQTKSFIDQPYIEVTGQADTLVTPNEIFIKIIISERDSKDKLSLEDLETRMINAFKSMTINTENDLTTSDMLSNYRFYLLKQKDILKVKEYILKVTDAATAARVFLKLEDIGISNTTIDRVEHTEYKQIENTCRTNAIETAKAKATSMTKPLNQSVGRAIYIADIGPESDNQLQGRLSGIAIRGYGSFSKAKYEPPKIEFQKIKITTIVNVKFILE
jgi:uncharacterized protein